MKTMTCKQLGGACDLAFDANTFDEMVELSKKHAMKMFQNGDESHIKAMNEMGDLMKRPNEMQAWFQNKRNQFNALPENK